jgi:hypothetical protein
MLAKEAAMQQVEYEQAIKYNATVAERERNEEARKKAANMVRVVNVDQNNLIVG